MYIANSLIKGAGRGVFASRHIEKDEMIERCPVIILQQHDIQVIEKTELINYYFQWESKANYSKGAICLGFGSIYNHSYAPNATYKKIFKERCIEFVAISQIRKDEEITVNYNNGNPDDKRVLWIKSIPPPVGYEKRI